MRNLEYNCSELTISVHYNHPSRQKFLVKEKKTFRDKKIKHSLSDLV
jgi:membrane-bound inhibitor of C-type lysozyme